MNPDELLNYEPNTLELELADRLLDNSHGCTAVLLALHAALVKIGDLKAARLVDSITERMAEHEAETM